MGLLLRREMVALAATSAVCYNFDQPQFNNK